MKPFLSHSHSPIFRLRALKRSTHADVGQPFEGQLRASGRCQSQNEQREGTRDQTKGRSERSSSRGEDLARHAGGLDIEKILTRNTGTKRTHTHTSSVTLPYNACSHSRCSISDCAGGSRRTRPTTACTCISPGRTSNVSRSPMPVPHFFARRL